MSISEILWVAGMLLVGLPIASYLTAKFVVIGYHVGKQYIRSRPETFTNFNKENDHEQEKRS